jgi:hypothetical protein
LFFGVCKPLKDLEKGAVIVGVEPELVVPLPDNADV